MESTQVHHHDAWNKGKLVGQKAPFKLKEIWSIRVLLEMQCRLRELALFDLGSTASCVLAISCDCACATCATAIGWQRGPISFNRDPTTSPV